MLDGMQKRLNVEEIAWADTMAQATAELESRWRSELDSERIIFLSSQNVDSAYAEVVELRDHFKQELVEHEERVAEDAETRLKSEVQSERQILQEAWNEALKKQELRLGTAEEL